MEHSSTLTEEQRENLVAYLDGELDDDEAAKVERLLAENPEAREAAELLSRTMALLDELPHVSTSQDFTARTLSAIQVVRAEETPAKSRFERWSGPVRRTVVLCAVVVALGAAGLVGYFSTTRWIPDPAEQLIRDLPLIENVDKYSEVDDIAFLRALEKSELFNEIEGIPEF